VWEVAAWRPERWQFFAAGGTSSSVASLGLLDKQ